MKECSHCKSDEGYYEKYTASGETVFYHNFDGSEADNGEMHEGLTYKLRSKFAFCRNCEKKLFRLDKDGNHA
ncbi:hypothetical protein EBB07_00905 [Paenibacillaceae bacterium]|nr:hypothetical protein EBB07_00905 [Paenibacillaceae bacterium]